MENLFLAAAGLGGALLVCQFAAGLFGLGGGHDSDTDADAGVETDGDHDVGHDVAHHTGSWLLGWFTFRSVSSAVTFFGLGGLTARYYAASEPAQLSAAVAGGGLALYAVAAAVKLFRRLRHDGTVRTTAALGGAGTVYLRVPGGNTGPGKVTLSVQGRTVEWAAYTAGVELPTGAAVRVVAVRGHAAVDVVAAA